MCIRKILTCQYSKKDQSRFLPFVGGNYIKVLVSTITAEKLTRK